MTLLGWIVLDTYDKNCNCPCLLKVFVVDWIVIYLDLVGHDCTLICSIYTYVYSCWSLCTGYPYPTL